MAEVLLTSANTLEARLATAITASQTYVERRLAEEIASEKSRAEAAEGSLASGKQDAITDLAVIRAGAASGATALHSSDIVPEEITRGIKIATIGGKEIMSPRGGGGTSDYSDLENKPQINGVELTGNKSAADLGITIPTKVSELTNDSGFLTEHQDISGKQDVLVSGESIKTIAGVSVLGSGDIPVVRSDSVEVAIGSGAEITGVETGIGGAITKAGNIVTHTFTDATINSTFRAPVGAKNFAVVLVGGGGGGARGNDSSSAYQKAGGGGGGGGVVSAANIDIVGGLNYIVKVGNGGSGGEVNTPSEASDGGDSFIALGDRSIVIAQGGKCGSVNYFANSGTGGNSGGFEIDGEYSEGYAGLGGSNNQGGGGAGSGENAPAFVINTAGAGGNGTELTINGVTAKYGAGGAGGSASNIMWASGGEDGGGRGGYNAGQTRYPEESKATSGTAYGAGGGGGYPLGNGGDGYQGIVVITYDVSDIAKAGVAIGYNAKSNAAHAIQLGEGTNTTAWSLQFHETTIFKNGVIPTGVLDTDVLTTDNIEQNLKTIGNQSIVGEGDISLPPDLTDRVGELEAAVGTIRYDATDAVAEHSVATYAVTTAAVVVTLPSALTSRVTDFAVILDCRGASSIPTGTGFDGATLLWRDGEAVSPTAGKLMVYTFTATPDLGAYIASGAEFATAS